MLLKSKHFISLNNLEALILILKVKQNMDHIVSHKIIIKSYKIIIIIIISLAASTLLKNRVIIFLLLFHQYNLYLHIFHYTFYLLNKLYLLLMCWKGANSCNNKRIKSDRPNMSYKHLWGVYPHIWNYTKTTHYSQISRKN